MLETVYLANPRGFCAGVKYAISYVEQAFQENPDTPLYVRKEIVHNQRVVEEMKKKGIRFISELSEVPDGATVVFSAHGVSPEVVKEATERKMKIGDATCPLVTRVHKKARNIRDTHQIIYIGHRGHDEAIGTMGEAEMFLVESPEDVENLKGKISTEKALTYLMQTTLSVEDTKNIVKKIEEVFPFVEHPQKDDICYATTERQDAVQKMLGSVDAMLVIGAENSSNSVRLCQLAKKTRPASFQISKKDDVNPKHIIESGIKILGITAGASSPQVLVDEIVEEILKHFPNAKVSLFPESREDTMSFKLPKELLKQY
ncbi:4-hydroxy-3-methylbut-2-enyl diphosphate reductase [Leptospira biflexa]|uniref:4-hydroxy-3-methylbut-2-enyl diphosphate reductase n=1 Tax=Leptospira biflexa TaxID=172 RepID=UPI00108369EF|nr:4-hydroxy-3-methylbut-2-enyl diphosphate reductase [Leptospira biflexa]TGM34361.1 4-hydroxy-3-methylbut-2-enyl diphosphate reductase [Leptospira biflexa]TGM39984.1 4-hydroxy-3-methylbut-2-enyl diphosphate reductase [Leptospira biflexa]TGM48423.1 4-hydroxy-3-methylbut-2-enyl diphosphate reductase [Leptospira biflexa]TGM49111.1 4-hydroxy-3-methylbut-2-enyl diphosphate reductase [Leptospira biflexa]TGM54381.1 4-hydroxy-3-methylbut-2-enyl diphosphate reductase [Leptospira biflexa]